MWLPWWRHEKKPQEERTFGSCSACGKGGPSFADVAKILKSLFPELASDVRERASALTAACDRLTEISQRTLRPWVSADEHRPNEGEAFLTVDTRGLYCVYGMDERLTDGIFGERNGVRITHWMSLPEPPK